MSQGLSVQNEVSFLINGKEYKVSGDVAGSTSLNTYVRDHAMLKGTKSMCQEGGCGACVVSVTSKDPVTKADKTYAVNSCLVPIFSCHGWSVTTIEGIGSKSTGFHPIQKRLSEKHGTQCGYCTPGMVMNMYALSKDRKVTMKEVENSFGGNICRCTGYRPILDAFKSLAIDSPPTPTNNTDIEDLGKVTKKCPKSGLACTGTCGKRVAEVSGCPVHLQLDGAEWFRVITVQQIFDTLAQVGDKPYMLVGGNTAQGVYRRTVSPQVMIDVTGVDELLKATTDPKLVLGANMSLTATMELFYSLAQTAKGYAYLKVLADHIDLIANVAVRNIGTIAGNLSIKHQYREFPSDMFLMLETVGATVSVMSSDGKKTEVPLPAYLDMDMKMRILHSVHLPAYTDDYVVKTYKIMPRAQNAHAYVNAGFVFKIDKQKNGMVLEIPNIVYGGIEPEFVHATKTENYLTGKNLFDPKTLEGALASLDKELMPNVVHTDASVAYRKGLAQSLFYKFVLSLVPDKVPKKLISGGQDFVRPLSSGKQEYETDKSIWPLGQPVAKLESLIQCSGEAQYVNDIHSLPGELYGALVLTRVGQGKITKIDPSEALKQNGVVAFFEAKDIPGKNSFVVKTIGIDTAEELFCSGEIMYAGQPVGILVATSQQLANSAQKLVVVDVENKPKGFYLMSDVLKSGDQSRIVTQRVKEATKIDTRKDATKVIKGNYSVGGQYHYTMETHSCVCVPIEDGMNVYPASQWMDAVQVSIAEVLNVPENSINVQVRRLGGAYGAKITRSSIGATACAVAAHHLNKPVRLVMTMETHMESCGKRYDCSATYEVGVDDEGRIKYLDSDFYQNSGCSYNESVVPQALEHMTSCYEDDTWTVTGKAVRTDTPSNTYCRAPGSVEGVALIEQIMEHVARVLGKDPVDVRIANMPAGGDVIRQLVKEQMEQTQYQERKKSVELFNTENRWKKRGIALVPMRYPFFFFGNFHAIVSVYAGDGTVSVAHGGIEMGQGINTKVAQVTAHILGIPLELVSVKPSNSLTAPNGMVSGGSVASESCSYAAMMCCKSLVQRLEAVKEKLKDPTWQETVKAAYMQGVDLCATYMFTPKDAVKNYDIWGVTVAEVEVDLLTGQPQILRVDILEDAGKSMSPEVDVGQVEGSFVMGIGYWLTESLVYHPETGELLTNRTWNYKPPGAKDIPIDFRIQLRRNAPNPTGVLRSKATGEPPLCMSVVVLHAVRHALDSARAESGQTEDWYDMFAPATTDKIFLTGLTNIKQFTL